MVYVAGALMANDHYQIRLNIDRAAAVGLEVAKLGAAPLIPHTNTGAWFIGTLTPRDSGTRSRWCRCAAATP